MGAHVSPVSTVRKPQQAEPGPGRATVTRVDVRSGPRVQGGPRPSWGPWHVSRGPSVSLRFLIWLVLGAGVDSSAPGVRRRSPRPGERARALPAPGFLSRGCCFHPTPPPASPVCSSHGWLFCFLTATLSTRHWEAASVSLSRQRKGRLARRREEAWLGAPPGCVRPRPRPERPRGLAVPCPSALICPHLPSSPCWHPSVLLLPFLMLFLTWGQPPHSHAPFNSRPGNTLNSKSRGRVSPAEGSTSTKAPGQDGAQRGAEGGLHPIRCSQASPGFGVRTRGRAEGRVHWSPGGRR